MQEIILATSNKGKLAELQAILSPLRCITQSSLGIDSAEETGLSFVENALLKARHASLLSGKPALADDSGLVVPALQGAPGIYSSRFAGANATDEENILTLLSRMAGLEGTKREAYFYCAIVLVRHAQDPAPLIGCGKFTGQIALKAQGSMGFGYDPIFFLPEKQCTAAELPPDLKNQISHRAKALRQLQQQLMTHDNDQY